MPLKDLDKRKDYNEKRHEDRKQHAIDSITSGKIIDQHKWNVWCNVIKRGAKNNKHPYTDEFTNDIVFEKMTRGCFYCGDIAMTIDRVDSTLEHTIDNCVASCVRCNYSKGSADSATFIRKAYYRARGEYVDDVTNIWCITKQKPRMDRYKKNAEKKGVIFELTKKVWETLIKGRCVYCKRTPTTWFGIDRAIPSLGYVIDNVFSCCFDCNVDKHVNEIDITTTRNELIAVRVDNGELVVRDCDKSILHKGINKTSNKVCAYGNVYDSKADASRALGKSDNYVTQCIIRGSHSNDIYEITEECI